MRNTNEYNKATYKAVTFRLNKEKDSDVIDFLSSCDGSVNALIVDAIRQVMPSDGEYELIEYYQGDHITHGTYENMTQAVNALIIRSAVYGGRYEIIRRYKQVSSGVTAGIKIHDTKGGK